MKLIISSFFILIILIGCGKDSKEDKTPVVSKTPQTKEQPKPKQNITKEKVSSSKKSSSILPSNDGTFKSIRNLIKASKNGSLDHVTYVCVGDSTRAESQYDGAYLFHEVRNRLYDFEVDSYLFARAGHKAKEFNQEIAYPTWEDVVYEINGDGRDTIVDICLGVNDYWSGNYDFKNDIKEAISKIRSQRPYVHFMLTMPDRVYGNESMTNFIKTSYIQLSQELHLPLVNVVDDLMPSQESTSYSLYRHDGFNVHLSKKGQHKVASDILLHILPAD